MISAAICLYFFTMLVLLMLAFLAANAHGFVQPGAGSEKKQAAQQLFLQTQSLRPALDLHEYISRLERVTALDGKFAEAFHELGRAYIEQKTIAGRDRAVTALTRAIQLAPRQTAYRYTLAMLQLQRGAEGAAKSEFRQMIKIDPLDARPYYQLALFREADMLHYRDLISPHENATIYFYEFADKDFAEAERLFRRAIALDPKMAEAYHHLAGLYFDAQLYEKMAALMEKAVTRLSAVDLFLFLGLARQQLGNPEAAMQAYQQALQLMPPADHALFYSLQTVLAPDSAKVYEQAPDSVQAQMQQRFWNARDPLFLTAANERLLEHFGRIAYANLRYGFPEKNIAGWKTDRGQTLIRFGQPHSRTRTRADLGAGITGRVTLNASKEIWNYGDFQMIFEDRFLNRQYAFAWGGVGEVDGKVLFEEKIRTEPERYELPRGEKRLDLPHVIAQFRPDALGEGHLSMAADSTRLEIYAGGADSVWPAGSAVTLQQGLFFFDENWNEIRHWRETQRFSSTSPNRLLHRWPVRMKPGVYHLVLEILDSESGHYGSVREMLVVENLAGDSLTLSTVVLAGADSSHPELALHQENGIHLVPTLLPEFSANQPIYVYYEIYNLRLDVANQSRYQIAYTLEPEAKNQNLVSRAVVRLGKMLGRDQQNVTIGSTFAASGDRRTEKHFHRVEIHGQPAGHYVLTIRATDQLSGQTASRRVTLTIK